MIRNVEQLEVRLIAGGTIRETRVHEPHSQSVWNDATTGEPVHGQAVDALRRAGKLCGLADGLFGEAQTYGLAECGADNADGAEPSKASA